VKATTEQLVSALRVLSVEMHSEDGVANAVVAEAADRLTLMANLVARHVEETKDDIQQMAGASDTLIKATAKIQSLRDRIKRLEEGGDEAIYKTNLFDREAHWNKAKEAKL
jgi:chemotaxis regulatin CheY-phosphate phosphatase CheZ